MLSLRTFISVFLQTVVLCIGVILAGVSGVVLYLNPRLPSVDTIRQIHLQTPLRVYTKSGKLIAEFGEKKRIPVKIDDVPPQVINALLAAEDARFYEHAGVDLKSLSRAFVELAGSGTIRSGGSTITMQLAKNYFLSSERSFVRKGKEVLLALKLERELTKDEILELYLNKIYLGNRAYGIAAAGQIYFGKTLKELTPAECALLAGLPKAPSANNPVNNPRRAKARRDWILGRMKELGTLNASEYDTAIATPVSASLHAAPTEVDASYVAEMARQFAVDQVGENAYDTGVRVYTTIDERLQVAATRAVRKGVIDYDRRHGYRGPENTLALTGLSGDALDNRLNGVLSKLPARGDLIPAVVIRVEDKLAHLFTLQGNTTLGLDAVKWARRVDANGHLGKTPAKVGDVLHSGDIVRLEAQPSGGFKLAQLPQVQAAMVSLDANTGALLALVGGFDFDASKFNRAIQGGRQPGSSFKPFIYTAALAKSMTPATVMNDAPLVIEDPWTHQEWRPANHGDEYLGPITLREALYKSKNLVSIRVLQDIGIPYTLDYLRKFSFDPAKLPVALSLALGSAEQTPLQIATGYTVFANQGFKVAPWWVARIENEQGDIIYLPHPVAACPSGPCDNDDEEADSASSRGKAKKPVEEEAFSATPDPTRISFDQAERVEESRIIWLINSMMKDVILKGTGRKAVVLNRPDIAGKTGTTNDAKDAWFSGFNPDVVATAWIGFDNPENLGAEEYGGTAALPIWIDYMREALKDKPVRDIPPPQGLKTVKIDPASGTLAPPGMPDAVFETFQNEKVPTPADAPAIAPGSPEELSMPEQVF